MSKFVTEILRESWQGWPLAPDKILPQAPQGSQHIIVDSSWVKKEIIDDLSDLGLTPATVQLFYYPPNFRLAPHVDGVHYDIGGALPHGAAINFGIGHGDWTIGLYDATVAQEYWQEKITMAGTVYYKLEDDQCQLVEEFNSQHPFILNIKQIHSVNNITQEKWTLSLRFHGETYDSLRARLLGVING